jgi:Delta6-protoilludene synthase
MFAKISSYWNDVSLQDLCSYNVEQSRGDDKHNIVKLIMLQEKTDLNGAMTFISNMHDRLLEKFLNTARDLPSFGEPIDGWILRYIDGLGNWVRASDAWSFESWRYFKGEGLNVQRDRWVELLPPVSKDEETSSSQYISINQP